MKLEEGIGKTTGYDYEGRTEEKENLGGSKIIILLQE
jgi:hypothetical protein